MRFLRSVTGRRASALAIAALASVVMAVTAGPASNAATSSPPQWTMFGQNLNNTANAPAIKINTRNVSALKPKWAFTTGGDISARAAVANGVAYFPDWSGHLYAVKSSSGKLVWSKDILKDYLSDVVFPTTPSKVVSRTSPFLDTSTHTLYIGTQAGAYLLAINATDGSLRWHTQLDPHPLAIDTGSPAVYNGSSTSVSPPSRRMQRTIRAIHAAHSGAASSP